MDGSSNCTHCLLLRAGAFTLGGHAAGASQPRSNAMASQPSLGTEEAHWNGGETRIARGSRPLIRLEFMKYWNACWDEASIATAAADWRPAAPPSGAQSHDGPADT